MTEKEGNDLNRYHKSGEQLKEELEQVEAAKANPERFGVLYDRYYKQVFVFVYRRTDDEETTADIVSQVFLKAMLAIKKYQFRGVPFSAWLFRIALNEINMYFRKSKADRVISLDRNDMGTVMDEPVEDAEKEQQLMKALAQLPEDAMQLIELRFFEKRSFAEVGDIVGITENNAKVRVYRVIEKLKTLLRKNR